MIAENLISIPRTASVLRTNNSEVMKMIGLRMLNGRINEVGSYSVRVDKKLEREMILRGSRINIEELVRESKRGHCLGDAIVYLSGQDNSEKISQSKNNNHRELRSPISKSKSNFPPKSRSLFPKKQLELISVFPENKDRKFLELYRDSFFFGENN